MFLKFRVNHPALSSIEPSLLITRPLPVVAPSEPAIRVYAECLHLARSQLMIQAHTQATKSRHARRSYDHAGQGVIVPKATKRHANSLVYPPYFYLLAFLKILL